jgi:2,3-bisphosphoglycerate-independent phosphoglycerate mutase
MARVFMLFMDGVGLGPDDPAVNPFATAQMPNLSGLFDGRPLLASSAPHTSDRATLLAIDACLGVPGLPQSATGQAVLLTGRNVPKEIGGHYGPKPNAAVAEVLAEGNIFREAIRRGGKAALLNAYPPRYFEGIRSGHRLSSAIPLAAISGGIRLRTDEDLRGAQALAADFTGEGWASQPDFPPASVYDPKEAGALTARLAREYDLAWFDYWLSDYAGHRATLGEAVRLLASFDGVLGGLIEAWADCPDLIVITSDHGNLEEYGRRGHTLNPVPLIVVGPRPLRDAFVDGLTDLTGVAPAILRALGDPGPHEHRVRGAA